MRPCGPIVSIVLMASLLTAADCFAAAACVTEIRNFKSALQSIRIDYPSHGRRISMNEVEEFARTVLPREIKPGCVGEIERTYPSQTLRLAPATGGLSFYEEAEHFGFGFHISDTGIISEVYAKAK